MCGILGGYGMDHTDVEQVLPVLAHRGPDAAAVMHAGKITLGHTRLAIRDLDARSDQPFTYGNVTIAYNGELWNDAALRVELEAIGCTFRTTSDTEVVAAALDAWGTDALPRFNGMFALAWTDGDALFLARDRFGEIPLHYFDGYPFAFASELKALVRLGCNPRGFQWVHPGGLVRITARGVRAERWYVPPITPIITTRAEAALHLRTLLQASVQERAISDVPVCTLLSGGIDSALVAYHLAQVVPNLVSYVAYMDPNGPDLIAARSVAEALSIPLVEVLVPEPTAADLGRVVGLIEQRSKAQVEIGWACLHLAERVRADGHKVVFSGEGSDELWASYGTDYYGIAREGWHHWRRESVLRQHRKNFARCNKVFMVHGVECRLPFLNPGVIEYGLSLPAAVVQDKGRPKAVLQDAYTDALPPAIIERKKLAFQTGMHMQERASAVVAAPQTFYRAEYAQRYGDNP